MVKNFDEMLQIVSTKNTKQQIVDARPPNLFNGRFHFRSYFSNDFFRSGATAGHLPNSLNVPYNTVFDQENQTLKSPDELAKLFKQSGLDLSKPSVYTCQTGTTASTLAFIAHILGQQNLSVYNVSYSRAKCLFFFCTTAHKINLNIDRSISIDDRFDLSCEIKHGLMMNSSQNLRAV